MLKFTPSTISITVSIYTCNIVWRYRVFWTISCNIYKSFSRWWNSSKFRSIINSFLTIVVIHFYSEYATTSSSGSKSKCHASGIILRVKRKCLDCSGQISSRRRVVGNVVKRFERWSNISITCHISFEIGMNLKVVWVTWYVDGDATIYKTQFISGFNFHINDFSKCCVKTNKTCDKPVISFKSSATSIENFSILLQSPLQNRWTYILSELTMVFCLYHYEVS